MMNEIPEITTVKAPKGFPQFLMKYKERKNQAERVETFAKLLDHEMEKFKRHDTNNNSLQGL